MGDDLMDFFNVRKEFKKVYLKVNSKMLVFLIILNKVHL